MALLKNNKYIIKQKNLLASSGQEGSSLNHYALPLLIGGSMLLPWAYLSTPQAPGIHTRKPNPVRSQARCGGDTWNQFVRISPSRFSDTAKLDEFFDYTAFLLKRFRVEGPRYRDNISLPGREISPNEFSVAIFLL